MILKRPFAQVTALALIIVANLTLAGCGTQSIPQSLNEVEKTYHPDLHGDDPQKRQVAGELTAELTRAYQALSAALGDGK